MRAAANIRRAPGRMLGLIVGWWWAVIALLIVRRRLAPEGLQAIVPAPPSVRVGVLRGAQIALRHGRATCLERSLVLQRLLRARGRSHDVVVGVRRPGAAILDGGAMAHAWLDGFDADCSSTFSEIARVQPIWTPDAMESRVQARL